MNLFDNEARQFKFDVLREVAKRTFQGELTENTPDLLANFLIPTTKANFRCCVYKEREVVRERTRLAMGLDPMSAKKERESQIVRVMEAACDGCTIKKIRITDNCRKCMAKSCVSACRFDAITMGTQFAEIDYDKCKECGACVNACSYSAIVMTTRPCKKSCSVDAITMDEHNIAKINEEKCINCGACQAACPFGAIEDVSQVKPVIESLLSNEEVVAVVAPSIQGQYDQASFGQIKESIRRLGFNEVLEAAIGADAVATFEAQELLEHVEAGKQMTTSCCPAFVNMARLHFPKVYQNNVSSMVSPMVAMGRYLKHERPNRKVVFIGPCVAKKQEAMGSSVDFVLTYEELAAMLVAKHIWPQSVEVADDQQASIHARNFAIGGGVSAAVKQVLKEAENPAEVVCEYADGAMNCKKALLLMNVGKFNGQILEGMACPGGCISGPATVEKNTKTKQRMSSENQGAQQRTIQSTLDTYDFSTIDLHVGH